MPEPPGTIQGWFRDHSDALSQSFRASERIKHNVTKGESREHQILDVLANLLPSRVVVEPSVVILDRTGAQSPKFDGALVNRDLWPRFFADGRTAAVMIESVVAAIETKSLLSSAEVEDITAKSRALRNMRSLAEPPRTAAFCYDCSNPHLSFLDFCVASRPAAALSASLVCVLNQCLFAYVEHYDTGTVAADDPSPQASPAYYATGKDSLLAFIYYLTRWVSKGTPAADTLAAYGNEFFSSLACVYFEDDFLDLVSEDGAALAAARGCFQRRGGTELSMLYNEARRRLGLDAGGGR
jgi:hypothetical protein